MKAHKYMVEAFWRLYWIEFVKWVKMENYEWRLDTLNGVLEDLYSEFDTLHQDADKIRIHAKMNVRSL